MSAQLSPDGMYYWDGQRWVSTLSPDGRSRWNGTAWVPARPPPTCLPHTSVGAHVARADVVDPTATAGGRRPGTSSKACTPVSLPFWMGGPMSQCDEPDASSASSS